MHIHILGICGTFMGGIAQIAAALGHEVSGSDLNVYPPMSEQLMDAGISILTGYSPDHMKPAPDLVLIGNAMSRGNEAVEYVLSAGLRYESGPRWLHDAVLHDRKVIAVAGTHGKTTTTSLIAWILEFHGKKPGYLIGGRANNFELSAGLGESDIFVIEADEYDTAFFDKRSKFLHYSPDIFLLNNLEFDHADIFDDVSDIRRQFHHAVRTVPANGLLIANRDSPEISKTLSMGCWTPVVNFGLNTNADWQLCNYSRNESGNSSNQHPSYEIVNTQGERYKFQPPIAGQHNALNTLAAIIAVREFGISPAQALAALKEFKGVKRRLDNYATVRGVFLYDDFAHHPTAIAATLRAINALEPTGNVHCVLEPRSNTMQNGAHEKALVQAFDGADTIFLYKPSTLKFDLDATARAIGQHCSVYDDTDKLIDKVASIARPDDHVIIMSNGGFNSIHRKLEQAILEVSR